ncbi:MULTISPECIES: transmembrane sensor/regulator PpyR [unclassified Pseudomonas]|uniref:transmembrane sensor/regulator PpyR n=1 Tax=unclassified Pseudomonas TaxID=196821 RepID=UPI00129ECFE6|nr:MULTISPECIES: transmembrane sensor/regulator PpyR [unclassified Pseudomonas]MDH4653773.1 transmembrane sensor/regulator PpyR [Pseudomonas sp. BN606]MRK22753.1 transmembrane sensor/regulator PpyR [Pseudomonas sp. JG-B]
MISLFGCPQRLLQLSHLFLWTGLFQLVLGIAGAYYLDAYLGLLMLIGAHGMVILGPTLIKLGYVMRLTAQYQMRKEERGLAYAVA